MERIENISEMQSRAGMIRKSGLRIGFVPTMGYLHQGHLSLIYAAKKVSDVVVVSIFVNPAQFGPNEDYNTYPRDISRDEKLAEEAGADIIFHPSACDMYPGKHLTWVYVEKLTEILCGAKRKGHFRGVTTVVSKLFHIVKPHTAVFGQKDAQQAAVIKKMVDDLNMDVTIHIAPTVREADGLAMSSRNVFLTPENRKNASILSTVLFRLKASVLSGEDINTLLEKAKKSISQLPDTEVEYIELRSYPDLEPMARFDRDCLIALAVRFGGVRLIDNVFIEKTS